MKKLLWKNFCSKKYKYVQKIFDQNIALIIKVPVKRDKSKFPVPGKEKQEYVKIFMRVKLPNDCPGGITKKKKKKIMDPTKG